VAWNQLSHRRIQKHLEGVVDWGLANTEYDSYFFVFGIGSQDLKRDKN
jgi:hypothetical protein